MFFLRICTYSLGDLMIGILKVIESVNFIKIKGPREARTYDKKISLAAGIGKILKNCLRTTRGEGWYISVYLFHEKWSFFQPDRGTSRFHRILLFFHQCLVSELQINLKEAPSALSAINNVFLEQNTF